MRKLIQFLKDYAKGDHAELELNFTWWEAGAILVIIGLVICIIVKY